MNNPLYEGPFKGHIQNYVELKQAMGCKFVAEANHLKRFDRFTLEKYPEATVLTKEIVFEWCKKKTTKQGQINLGGHPSSASLENI